MRLKFLISVICLGLFGWATTALYVANMDFAEVIKNPEPPWMIEVNVLPILAAIVIGGILTLFLYIKSKQKHKSWTKAFFLPPEFAESDEREKEITAKACRASYVMMWYSFPLLAALLLIYPFISEIIPYYPIIVLLLLPLLQTIAYFITWRKHY